ncbi:MAG: hypothetical protein ACE361_03855 [Aureliella sp.]
MIDLIAYAIMALAVTAAGAMVVLAVLHVMWMRRVANRVEESIGHMEKILEGQSLRGSLHTLSGGTEFNPLVPPLSIHFEEARNQLAIFGAVGRIGEQWLLDHRFEYYGQFIIEELGYEQVRCYLSPDQKLIASIRCPHDAEEAYVEFCYDLGDGQLGGVANPPASTVPLADSASGRFFDGSIKDSPQLLASMHEVAIELTDAQPTNLIPRHRDAIARCYEEAHRQEMLQRLSNGGITKQEIRDTLSQQGQIASEDEITEIHGHWQQAIDAHVVEHSPRSKNQFYAGRPLMVVHSQSSAEHLKDRLESTLQQVEDLRESLLDETFSPMQELKSMLEQFSPREAIARFRPLLPKETRFQLIDQTSTPIEADVYVLAASDGNSHS